MKEVEVADKIKHILVDKLGLAETEITPDANLVKDLGVDSLDYAELVMEFEQAFDIRIPDSDAEELTTIESVISYVEVKVKANP
ncbi:MAG: acyl carrier protein [Cyclobacteriaceae bacterium]|nr:acyl carrier protein [Cyclobacteriaceae bacterium]